MNCIRMKDFKVGGKITLESNETYIIVEILIQEGNYYLFCCTEKKPIVPVLLSAIEENGKILVKIEEDTEILKNVAEKILKQKWIYCNTYPYGSKKKLTKMIDFGKKK